MRKFFYIIVFLLLSNSLICMEDNDEKINRNSIEHAKIIANNILNIEVINKNVKKIEYGINDIIKDHSQNKHLYEDSYFITNERNRIKEIIELCVNDPDKFKFYRVYRSGKWRYRLAISKKISQEDSLRIFGENYIGKQKNEERYRIFLGFDITGIIKLSDSKEKGGFLTGFPCTEEYNLEQF